MPNGLLVTRTTAAQFMTNQSSDAAIDDIVATCNGDIRRATSLDAQ
jgi:hypothetical protein